MTKQHPQDHEEISNRLKDVDRVNAALKRAARDAVQEHAREGRKIVVWRDGRIVWEDATIEEAPKQ
ncbi:hypothetical protein [Candidatus Laterigemmans baculatus]|uniref:hypothetical protein n=1 Tax=Candidatus Laterigemmans baculatus TaxID=2770505 RepID=UPI0013DA043C|nr:hypothetical protein [Candidatus Laterigemmans baculatus]